RDLDSAKAAVIPLVRERGGEEALRWRDRGYTVYLAETPVGESVDDSIAESRLSLLCGPQVAARARCVGRLSRLREKIAGRDDFIPQGPVASLPPSGHLGQHGFVRIHVIVDHDLAFGRMEAVQSAGILCEGSAPGYWHGEKQRIEACIV